MKTYVITLSQHFPATHPRKGQLTHFNAKLSSALWIARGGVSVGAKPKLHTIRANYLLWEERFKKINRGEACLSIRQWTGKPYASKQVEIARLTKEDGIGIQKLTFDNNDIDAFNLPEINDDHTWQLEDIAENDGLDIFSWLHWFENYNLSQPMAIIHFTKFRYK